MKLWSVGWNCINIGSPKFCNTITSFKNRGLATYKKNMFTIFVQRRVRLNKWVFAGEIQLLCCYHSTACSTTSHLIKFNKAVLCNGRVLSSAYCYWLDKINVNIPDLKSWVWVNRLCLQDLLLYCLTPEDEIDILPRNFCTQLPTYAT